MQHIVGPDSDRTNLGNNKLWARLRVSNRLNPWFYWWAWVLLQN